MNIIDKPGKSGILLALIIAAGLAYNYFSEKKKQKTDEKEWFENEFLPKEFAGKIRKLEIKDQEEKCLAEIRIVTAEDSVSYLLDPCNNKDFFNFAKTGDSVFKTPNSSRIKVIKTNQESKEFKFPVKLRYHK